MITEIDIWRAAQLLLRWYGGMAQQESIRRIEELSAAYDLAGVAIWMRIIDAIDQLANITPPGPVH
ncbi:MAG: hypothetical protein WB611_24970 [Stellaceae bacterium]